ncbi:DUF3083 family protein [Thalassotalea litorea]|uniref:DUF3083 family protein n=1 Tax=Thalassotalea litorea TaxID=2020715 RepID=A0A5R9IE80_9GAMM|nr:DUF3083 family protein [Thalassotalea litorea]TLU59920.1 DUF3083 family protein [Thalassotalea litorea]
MLQHRTRSSLIRKRSAAHKVYVPATARQNQYLLIEVKPDSLLTQFQSTYPQTIPEQFYQALTASFFQMCAQHNIENASFIAKDKLVRVIYSEEQQVIETDQQLLFLYNPTTHQGRQRFYDPQRWARKIQLLFLATGEDIRENAPQFHQKITQLITEFVKQNGLHLNEIEVKDFQHLTYDVFAAHKGEKRTQPHGFRPIEQRYLQQQLILPAQRQTMTFAIANLPVTNGLLRLCDIDGDAMDPYNPLYTLIADRFTKLARQYNLNHLAMVANGRIPIIRQSDEDSIVPEGELLNLGFDTHAINGLLVSQWDASKLVETIRLVFIASDHNCSHRGYGRFINQVTQVLAQLATQLGYTKEKDTITLRVHQHLMHQLPEQN